MPKARAGGQEEHPHVQGAVAVWVQEGLKGLFHVKIRRGGGEEIPLIEGKEQRLHFAGTAMKRYPHVQGKRNPSKTVGVARGHPSQKTSHSNHTRTTALSNSMKLSHALGATQDGQVMVERSDRMWSTGKGKGKPLQYSRIENPMNSMKSVFRCC